MQNKKLIFCFALSSAFTIFAASKGVATYFTVDSWEWGKTQSLIEDKVNQKL